MELLLDKNIDRTKWIAFYCKCQYSTPFNSPEYYDFINSLSGYSARAFAVIENMEIKALAVVVLHKETGIKAFFSRRGIIYGGPLLENICSPFIDYLLDYICKNLSKKVIYIEVRNFNDYSKLKDKYTKLGWDYLSYVNVKLNTADKNIEEIVQHMKYNRRREIRLSLEQGASYSECKNSEELFFLYQILNDLYKKRVKLPLPPFEFFNQMYLQKIAKVFVVEHNNIIIGGSICLYTEMKGIYTFYYCGKRNYHKKIFPTHLAVLAAIEFAVNNKIPEVDFMGAGLKDEVYGVRDYKLEFGAVWLSMDAF
jgi:hypothetical protein